MVFPTAEEYLPENPDAKYFYVYKICWRCNIRCSKLSGPSLKAHGIESD
jgi:hypothetical protein